MKGHGSYEEEEEIRSITCRACRPVIYMFACWRLGYCSPSYLVSMTCIRHRASTFWVGELDDLMFEPRSLKLRGQIEAHVE